MHPDFSGKTLLITGGTGSFGNGTVARLLETGIGEIRIFSRDEKSRTTCAISAESATPPPGESSGFTWATCGSRVPFGPPWRGRTTSFTPPPSSRYPPVNFFPLEAVRTNVLGTGHVLEAAAAAGVKALVCLSTDKAAYPINAMGASKALMEKPLLPKPPPWGRVVPGSPAPGVATSWAHGAASSLCFCNKSPPAAPLTLTEPSMTRFLMTMDEAIDLVLLALTQGQPGDIWVRKAPACTLGTWPRPCWSSWDGPFPPLSWALAMGEKLAETLLTAEEAAVALDCGACFRIPQDRRDLHYGLTPAVPTALGGAFFLRPGPPAGRPPNSGKTAAAAGNPGPSYQGGTPMKVLVTGAGGFLGRNLLAGLETLPPPAAPRFCPATGILHQISSPAGAGRRSLSSIWPV